MDRRRSMTKAASCLPAFFVLAALTAFALPVRAADRLQDNPLSPGTYAGTFTFTLEHTYNAPGPSMPMNYYSWRADGAMGSIRFTVREDGVVPGVNIRIPAFAYNAVNSQTITVPEGSQGEYHCTGNNGYAAGMATASGGSGMTGAPPLSPHDFFTKSIQIKPGDPWGRVSLTGKCPGAADTKKFTEAVKADVNSLPASPWTFSVTWTGFQSAGGTCATAAWQTANRSISCYWAAYVGGYKRWTAPGPG